MNKSTLNSDPGLRYAYDEFDKKIFHVGAVKGYDDEVKAMKILQDIARRIEEIDQRLASQEQRLNFLERKKLEHRKLDGTYEEVEF